MNKHGAFGRCPVGTSVGSWGRRLGAVLVFVVAHAGPATALSLPDLPPMPEAATPGTIVIAPAHALDCLADAVYYEAGGEPRAGREAVAQVVLNRLHSPAYPKTVCGVVFQGSERSTGCQFTFTCNGAMARRPDTAGWADAQAIAETALAGRLVSAVGPSTHYHAVWVHPTWRLAMTPTLRIGGHQFYQPGPRLGATGLGRAEDLAVAHARPPGPAAFDVWGLQVAMVTPARDGAAAVGAR